MYRSTNHGTSWTAINEGLPIKMWVNSLSSDGLYLYAGMDAHSVWRRPLAQVTEVRALPDAEMPTRFALAQNYPNPFNPSCDILYALPQACRVWLGIYDIQGQKIRTVYQGYISAGANFFDLSLPENSRAEYIYVLKMGDRKVSGKLMQMGTGK